MRLRLTRRALADAKRKKSWWQRHRDVTDLFEQELDTALQNIAATPALGQRVEQRSGGVWVRRWLMPKTRNYVYYVMDGTEVVVLTVWGAPRRRAPKV
jgi:plasmid stabilization system protein ParE